jgi:hypothetical protein
VTKVKAQTPEHDSVVTRDAFPVDYLRNDARGRQLSHDGGARQNSGLWPDDDNE